MVYGITTYTDYAYSVCAWLMHKLRGNLMKPAYDRMAAKKATNLSINSDLLTKARQLKLNLSATLESALAEEIRKAEREQWLQQNEQAIDEVNEFTEEYGLFSDSYRTL